MCALSENDEYCGLLATDIYNNLKLFGEPRVDSTSIENLVSKYSILNNVFETISSNFIAFQFIRKYYPNIENINSILRNYSDYWLLDLDMNSKLYPEFKLTFKTYENNIRGFLEENEQYEYYQMTNYDSFDV